MAKALLDAILSKEHKAAGLKLEESEHFVYLKHKDYQDDIAVFSAHGVTISEIRKEADKYLTGDAIKELVKCGGIEIKTI
jgi:hypothetical protein